MRMLFEAAALLFLSSLQYPRSFEDHLTQLNRFGAAFSSTPKLEISVSLRVVIGSGVLCLQCK